MDTHHLLPAPHRQHLRRRSADVGGLHLAMENTGHGQGWVGDSGDILSTKFAELLVDMYTSTLHAVNEQGSDFAPAELPLGTRSRLIKSMETWEFEPHKLPEEELLACTLILFEVLYRIEGLEEAIGVSMKQITPFVYHLRRIYRLENSYHNFEHALDVLQAVYSYLRAAGMVPPLSILHEPGRKWAFRNKSDCGALITSLGLHELFVLYVAAIGHDVGHPGFTNTFMKNASTPLSEVYDGKSALEQMHSQLLLRVAELAGNVFQFADLDTTICHMAREALANRTRHKMSIVREELTEKCGSLLLGYRKNCAAASRIDQMILPEVYKSLPSYVLALTKSKPLKGLHVSSDVRNYHAHRMNSMPIRSLIHNIYPQLMALHDLEDDAALPSDSESTRIRLPSVMRSSHTFMEANGIYLIDNEEMSIFWIGHSVSSQLLLDLFGVDDIMALNTKIVNDCPLLFLVLDLICSKGAVTDIGYAPVKASSKYHESTSTTSWADHHNSASPAEP
ncbi:hypothetical protein C0993_008729 [Termitomyces sp. T159_Od127]|nr:hypothetical protein C0993_008729 [Termitomyces sp. T159_Od127]